MTTTTTLKRAKLGTGRRAMKGTGRAAAATNAEAYDDVLAEAEAVEARDRVPLRADTATLYRNTTRGVAAVDGVREALTKELPALDWRKVDRAMLYAMALRHAANLVDRSSPRTLTALVGRAYACRGVLLPLAESLARKGLLDAHEVARIKKGRGRIDAARDCVDLASLFRAARASLSGKLPVSDEDIDEAARVGGDLLTLLKPGGAAETTSPTAARQIAVRDAIYALLQDAYQEVRRAGMYSWADDVDGHVPRLRSTPHSHPTGTTGRGADGNGQGVQPGGEGGVGAAGAGSGAAGNGVTGSASAGDGSSTAATSGVASRAEA